MSKDSIEILVAITGCVVGLAGALTGFYLYWKGSIEKRYAAQRDFGHLKRNYEQLVNNIEQMAKEQDTRFDRLDLAQIEMKSMLHTLIRQPPEGRER